MRRRPSLAVLLAALLAGSSLVMGCAQAQEPAGTPSTPQRVSADDAVTSVLAISIDGLNPTALERLGVSGTPNLHELAADGASTLNARTERELTITLPNHTGMVTGRRIERSLGGHGVTWNDDRRRPTTVQQAAGHGVESLFSVVNASGGSAAVFASKTKFSLWKRSWPDGIDRMVIKLDNPSLVDAIDRDLLSTDRELRFLHLSLPDNVGHDRGFMSRAYLQAVRQADTLVGSVLDTVASAPALAAGTAVILTSDHGGLGADHSDARSLANYRVPFMVRGPGITPGSDLYDLNPDYADPGARRTSYAAPRQPVRNGDLANLALDLLDLPAVPGSEHNAGLDLDVTLDPAAG
ncbi:alkaline phosphatase family protein [Nocardioides alpinus]|uniref:Type I phosphodiesterase / nucleotide pyrophosphatase n=1 Tax=Nocardioides alpinus TaxID=748909 RepID=A0ABX4QRP0_9ACTN|nr:alkaline phosphatase family protein [Nocardioides alpinus]PKH37116.1 hypothetical protein CXG46_16595 [Nocardioides alpinus]